jgi:hypothetical protein
VATSEREAVQIQIVNFFSNTNLVTWNLNYQLYHLTLKSLLSTF